MAKDMTIDCCSCRQARRRGSLNRSAAPSLRAAVGRLLKFTMMLTPRRQRATLETNSFWILPARAPLSRSLGSLLVFGAAEEAWPIVPSSLVDIHWTSMWGCGRALPSGSGNCPPSSPEPFHAAEETVLMMPSSLRLGMWCTLARAMLTQTPSGRARCRSDPHRFRRSIIFGRLGLEAGSWDAGFGLFFAELGLLQATVVFFQPGRQFASHCLALVRRRKLRRLVKVPSALCALVTETMAELGSTSRLLFSAWPSASQPHQCELLIEHCSWDNTETQQPTAGAILRTAGIAKGTVTQA